MCGIVGYIGSRPACDFLIEGLRRLEYRGYDSSGVATLEPSPAGPADETGRLAVTKTAGRIADLASTLEDRVHDGTIGIGHTRWATHGLANDLNAHPHVGGDGELVLVHNGTVNNYQQLKEQLEQEGFQFQTATDTEVVAHLIASELRKQEAQDDASRQDRYAPLVAAVQAATAQLRGTYGIAVLFRDWPDAILVARLGSPLVIGVGQGANYIASDGQPLVGHTDRVVQLADRELAIITADNIHVVSRDEGPIAHSVEVLEIEASQVELDGYPHYMLKEIFEQPETIRNAMR
ncbi:MAG: class II glutamine amidotransferase, partial [Planctomycetota bacterium]